MINQKKELDLKINKLINENKIKENEEEINKNKLNETINKK